MKNKMWYLVTGAVIFVLLIMSTGCLVPSTTSTINNGTIQFQVTDSAGTPLQGAKVVSDLQPKGQLKLTGLTDVDGAVVFQNIRPGDYKFYINRFDYNEAQIAFIANHGRITDVPVKLIITNAFTTTPVPPVSITGFKRR
jgi:protocatechuate 3,4-dioxygenase beta subunit